MRDGIDAAWLGRRRHGLLVVASGFFAHECVVEAVGVRAARHSRSEQIFQFCPTVAQFGREQGWRQPGEVLMLDRVRADLEPCVPQLAQAGDVEVRPPVGALAVPFVVAAGVAGDREHRADRAGPRDLRERGGEDALVRVIEGEYERRPTGVFCGVCGVPGAQRVRQRDEAEPLRQRGHQIRVSAFRITRIVVEFIVEMMESENRNRPRRYPRGSGLLCFPTHNLTHLRPAEQLSDSFDRRRR